MNELAVEVLIERYDDQIAQLTKDRDQLAAKCAEMRHALGMSTPWPVIDILHTLSNWCDHLGEIHGCDCNGYEVRGGSVKAARAMIEKLHHALSDQCGVGWLSPEKAGRLREALKTAIDFPNAQATHGILKQALEDCK